MNEKLEKIDDNEETMVELNNMVKYEHIFFHNFRNAILNYVSHVCFHCSYFRFLSC